MRTYFYLKKEGLLLGDSIEPTFNKLACFFLARWFFSDCSFIHHHLDYQLDAGKFKPQFI